MAARINGPHACGHPSRYRTIEGRTVTMALRAARMDTRLRDARSIEVTVRDPWTAPVEPGKDAQ